MRCLPIIVLFAHATFVSAQDPVPFTTAADRFMVFANGRFEKMEPRPPQRVFPMDEQVVYLDFEGRMKIFLAEGRRLYLLQEGGVGEVRTTRHRIVWNSRDTLKTLRDGHAAMLARNVERFTVSDSLVVVHDSAQHELNVLWRGRTIPLAVLEQGSAMPQWNQASNTITFFNKEARSLFLFYRGALRVLCDSTDVGIVATGGDLVGYWDGNKREFRAMYKGTDRFLSDLRPVSAKAGEGIMGFVDGTGMLKCFADGEVHTLTREMPSAYWVQDSLLLFVEDGGLRLFRSGGVAKVENYVPERWQVQGGDLVYLDINRELRGISQGERVRYGSEANIATFDLFGESLFYPSPTGLMTVVRKGRTYAF
ncbi:MAG: hypothetical protein ABI432_00815 [Flavobacteriales bacterium]